MIVKRHSGYFPVLAVLSALVGQTVFAATAAAQAPARAQIQTVTLGIVSETHRARIEERFRDFVRYLAAKLGPGSAFEGKVLIAPTPFQLARLIEQKRVDLYMESPYPTYLVNEMHGVAKLLLQRWKSGMAEYRSLLFSQKNGAVTRLEDLRGRLFVFEDPGSTSGYFLPKSFLLKQGFKFADKRRFDPHGSPAEIGYVFANSQEKLIDMVLAKRAAAGAFSDDDFARLDDKRKSAVAVLAQTERLPRHFISVRKDASPALVDRLQEILLSMHENEPGRSILKQTDDTTKFDRLAGGEAGMRRRLAEIFGAAEKN